MKINDVSLNSARAMLESIYNTDGFVDDRSRRSKTSLNLRCYIRVWNLWTEGKLQRDTRWVAFHCFFCRIGLCNEWKSQLPPACLRLSDIKTIICLFQKAPTSGIVQRVPLNAINRSIQISGIPFKNGKVKIFRVCPWIGFLWGCSCTEANRLITSLWNSSVPLCGLWRSLRSSLFAWAKH